MPYTTEQMRIYQRNRRARIKAAEQAAARREADKLFAANLGTKPKPEVKVNGNSGALLDFAAHDYANTTSPELQLEKEYFGTDAEIIRDWAKDKLKIPSGPMMGKPFIIDDFQFDFLQDALQPHIKMAALSVSRKNGKSGLISVALLCTLCGPLNRRDWRGVVVSEKGSLAKELYRAMESTAKISGLNGLAFYKTPTPGQVFGWNDAHLLILNAEKSSGVSIGTDWAVIDEAGILQENKRELWNNIIGSTGSRNGKLICISIRSDGPMFEELYNQRHLKSVVWHEYCGRIDLPYDSEENWHLGNPGLKSGIKSIDHMRTRAEYIMANPADQSSFAADELNIPGVSGNREMICSVHDWKSNQVDDENDLPQRTGQCLLGIDMGGAQAMSAAVACWTDIERDIIRVEVKAAFPDTPDLKARGRADGCGLLYQNMFDRGELLLTPGKVTDMKLFLQHLKEWLAGEQIFVFSDRHRKKEFENEMDKANLTWPIEWRGQGHSHTADGSADVRGFQNAVLTGRLAFLHNLVMDTAIKNSMIIRDASGNPKLVRVTAKGRNDALQAGVMSIAAAQRMLGTRKRSVYHGMV